MKLYLPLNTSLEANSYFLDRKADNRYIANYGGWFVPFRFFVCSPGVMARRQDKISQAKRRNNEKMPWEIKKKDKITPDEKRNVPHKMTKNARRNNAILNS